MELEWKKDNVLKFKCVVGIILNTSILLETETVSFCWVTIQLRGIWASPLIDFRFETSTITRGNYCFCKFESTASHYIYILIPPFIRHSSTLFLFTYLHIQEKFIEIAVLYLACHKKYEVWCISIGFWKYIPLIIYSR